MTLSALILFMGSSAFAECFTVHTSCGTFGRVCGAETIDDAILFAEIIEEGDCG